MGTHGRAAQLTVDEIDRLSRMISEMYRKADFDRECRKRIVLGSADLSDLTGMVAMTYDPLYRSKSVDLKREIELMYPLRQMRRKKQAVENLLSNAHRYTDSGGLWTLSLARSDGTAVIKVSDTGIGISEQDLPYIFERFYRTDKSRTRSSGGLGIGLAITRAIVEAHGGNVRAESREGKGSTFTITLPLKRA
jgi:signal transduction histidine kinase